MKAVRTLLCLLLFCLKVLEKTGLKYADLKPERLAECINAVLILKKWKILCRVMLHIPMLRLIR